ncbi:hypothetical protein Cgig2_006337 [Carnegiea gigantea]|uniref:Uncharacterized protein n=1 Tax=Carnegiea gigantea TaxID=171969 RepID=A0A9Q1GKY2_9CARY|nr:hypothetical protein Cgig2_006337 [Carnegiea gigantea]
MLDALENFMTTMTDAITRQVSKQVKRTMEAANSVRPLPLLITYLPTEVSPPTGQSGYHLPVTQSGSEKYLDRTEASRHTTTECRELKKALHELVDKGQIDRFLKRGPWFIQREQEPAQPQPWDGECSTEVVAIIARVYAEGMTQAAWKVQLKSTL